jgi:hypothetical protein
MVGNNWLSSRRCTQALTTVRSQGVDTWADATTAHANNPTKASNIRLREVRSRIGLLLE